MNNLLNFPFIVFAISLVALWLSALFGVFLCRKHRPADEGLWADFGVVQAAILTLLSLLIGFTFSMAVNRYDQRKNYEEAEANAIGTEYVRADVLPDADAAKVRALLRTYLDQRVLFYVTRDSEQLRQIDAETTRLQNEMWSTVQIRANAQPNPVIALVVSGMNDVLNSQGYTQAAWWYRIPPEGWNLMGIIAIFCNLMMGYSSRRANKTLLLILPLAVSVSFFLIADIDSPRAGLIHVQPQNLLSLARSLNSH
jgi:hypothetical protein